MVVHIVHTTLYTPKLKSGTLITEVLSEMQLPPLDREMKRGRKKKKKNKKRG